MNITVATQDGALGYSPSADPVYCIGPATRGSTTAVQTFGDPALLYPVYESGKLPDRVGRGFGQGIGPWTCLRMAASTAGSLPTYRSALTAALAGNDAGNAFSVSAQPAAPRSVEVTFGNGYDGGDVTVVGVGADDAAITEVITATANTTVKGKRVFKSITSAAKGAVGANAATARIYTGNKSAEGASSTDTQVVLSGTPTEDVDVIARLTRNGTVAGGTSACIISYDGRDSFGAETPIPAGGAVTGLYGITLTFTGSALKTGDEFRQLGAGPTSTNNDLTAALGVLSTLNCDGGELHILGGLSGSIAATLATWIAAERAAGRDWQVYCETRDYTAGESDATYVAALKADFASVQEPVGALSAIPGWWETVLPAGKGIQRRPFGWAVVDQIWRLPIHVHPSCQQDGGGPLRGLYTPIGAVTPNTHDERLSPGLGGSGGRFLTVQSLPGTANLGLWFVGDYTGKRSPGTLAAGTSDFSLLMNARVANRTRRAVQAYGAKLLASRYNTKADGTLTAAERLRVQGEIRSYLLSALGEAVQPGGVRVVVSSTEQIRRTKKLPYQVFLNTWAYALEVSAIIGLEPVA